MTVNLWILTEERKTLRNEMTFYVRVYIKLSFTLEITFSYRVLTDEI